VTFRPPALCGPAGTPSPGWLLAALILVSVGLLGCANPNLPDGHGTPQPGDEFRELYERHLPYYVPVALAELAPGPRSRALLARDELRLSFRSDSEWAEWNRPRTPVSHGISLARRDGAVTVAGVLDVRAAKLIIPGARLLSVDGKIVVGMDAVDIYSGPLARAGVRSVRVTVLNPDGNVVTADLRAGRWRAETAPDARTVEGKARKTFGYIRIPALRPGEMAAQCKALVDKGIAGLILDCRDCRGGLVGIAAEAASVFVPAGAPLFQIRQRTQDGTKTREVVAEAGTARLVIPIALLVNEGTASGSELLAAALTDAGVGVAVGTRTFGSGLIRSMRRVEELGGYLLVPVGEYLRSTGEPLFPTGIEPELKIACERENLCFLGSTPKNDLQLQAAVEYLETR